MASTDVSSQGRAAAEQSARFPWPSVLWFAVLLIAGYAPVLKRMVQQWASDPDMGHGFFVPVVAGYIAWLKRRELMNLPEAGNWWGAAVVVYAALQLTIATLGVELFLARTAFVISLVGVLLMLRGLPAVKTLAFPLFLLLFMVPIPALIFNQITFPLQLLASQVAEVTLNLIGIPVFREGNILELPSQRLSVVEACSGIRSLLSLSFLALVYAYFFDRKVWMRGALLVAAVPIAIAVNAARVTITGILSEYKKEWAEGFLHAAEGWIMFMLALAVMIVVHQIINKVYMLARDEKQQPV